MSEHGSRRGGGGGGSRGRRSAGGGFSDKLDGLTNQLSGMFAKRRGGGRRGGDGYDDQYDEYGSYDNRGYGADGYDDGYGEPADVASGGGRRGAGRRSSTRSGGSGRPGGSRPNELPPKDWWMKFINYPRYGKRGWRHWMPSIKQVLAVFLGFLFTVIGLVAYAYANTQIPLVKNSIAAGNPTQFTYDNGEIFNQIGVNYYQVNDINQIPTVFQNAFVAAENYSFWSDPGVSFTGVARSALNDLFGSNGTQGGSTITQEYVKNAYLSQDQTLGRKLNEVMISIKLNHQESKQQILLGYLNQISFGRGAYGIDAASRAYFGVPISKMTNANVAEAAFLASVINDPSNFSTALANPKARTDNPKTFDRFQKRYNAVLANMSQYKFVPKSVTDPLQGHLPKVKDYVGPNLKGYVGYMKDAATQYLAAQMEEYPNDPATQKYANIDNLSKGGYKIVTTYNHAMMNDSHDAADALWKGTSGGGGGKLNPSQPSDHDVHLAFASIDPKNGEVKSFYTGTDGQEEYTKNAFNYAIQGGVQVGSTFKPITLATALQTGKFSLDSQEEASNFKPLYWPVGAKEPMTYTDTNGNTKLYPPNEDDEAPGGPTGMATLKQGLALSLNSVFVSLELDPSITPTAVYNMAVALGIKPDTQDLGKVPALTLGVSEITPMRMANVYSAFDDGGVAHEPVQVSEIVDQRTNQVVWTPPALRPSSGVNKQVMSANTAAGVTNALQSVFGKGGTASQNSDAAALSDKVNGNLAGKTGTSDNGHSAWFTGFSSSLVTSVALFRSTPDSGAIESLAGLGYDDPTKRINGNDWSTSVWSAFMNIELGKNKDNFAKPFAPYAPTCSGVSALVTPGQSVAPGPLATNSLPGTPTGSEANCQSVFVPTPSPTPTPTPTTSSSSSQQQQLCQPPKQFDPATQQCVLLPTTSTDTTSSQPTPSGTDSITSSPPWGQPSTTPSTSSSQYCKRNPTDPACPTTSSSSSSSSGFGLPTG